MVTVNEPQVWTLIGVFAASMGAMITLVIMTMNAKLSRIETVMDIRFDALGTRLDGMERRLDGVERKLEAIDGDVQAISRRIFGADQP